MIRRLLCFLFGHSRWEFDGSAPLQWFRQAPRLGPLTVGQHFCRRCHVFYGLPFYPATAEVERLATKKPTKRGKR